MIKNVVFTAAGYPVDIDDITDVMVSASIYGATIVRAKINGAWVVLPQEQPIGAATERLRRKFECS